MNLFKSVYTFEEVKNILDHEVNKALKIDDESLINLISEGKIDAYQTDAINEDERFLISLEDIKPIPKNEVMQLIISLRKNNFYFVIYYWMFKKSDIIKLINELNGGNNKLPDNKNWDLRDISQREKWIEWYASTHGIKKGEKITDDVLKKWRNEAEKLGMPGESFDKKRRALGYKGIDRNDID